MVWPMFDKSPTFGKSLKELELICERRNAVPVVILSSLAHESTVRPGIKAHDLKMGVGIDRWVPRSDYNIADATMIAYGFTNETIVFLIDPDGVIRHVQSGLGGIEKAMGRSL